MLKLLHKVVHTGDILTAASSKDITVQAIKLELNLIWKILENEDESIVIIAKLNSNLNFNLN